MVAFELFGWPIYRYGIFYLITFGVGYRFLRRAGRQQFVAAFPRIQTVLQEKRDDLMLVILLGVIVGGRLGHVLLYELDYYLQHPVEIVQVRQGGMAFVGGLLGVVLGLMLFAWWQGLKKDDYLLLGDLILCIVPIGSLLGRIGNSLNQELRGVPVTTLPTLWQELFKATGLVRVYPAVDQLLRVDTNLLQSALEGGLILIITRSILLGVYQQGSRRPGLITGVFLIGYGLVRFPVEFIKDIPVDEYRGVLTVSQWLMIGFLLVGFLLVWQTKKTTVR